MSLGRPPNSTYLPLSFNWVNSGKANLRELYVDMKSGTTPKTSYISFVIKVLNLYNV